ncbi:Crp/Fnr family transcriptional regulator [Alkalicoccus daliensis]|uniref:CRP/FNR family transcriptional regulator, anaerobic regulatory protein n=1 Tax=Alkalicoccus daliensis TaxID=745820 RepID=A0A1H0HJG9_9BACI|nr:Crp/Fnr family transcriptional regulator [Alkalicoccus daliensis]SDO19359.1 CRP/FNR family transcriptional regulator, anaerobic regulatory protein [Alkalicoccus daliensis]
MAEKNLTVSSECNHQSKSHSACISKVPIFNHLENEQMDEIMQTVRPVSFKKGELLYRAGEVSDSLYIVNQGKVKIYRLSAGGKEQLIRLLLPGDFTGELALFHEGTHEVYAEAMEKASICMITRTELQQFLLKFPSISLKILQEFSSRLDTTEKQASRTAMENVETRLAMFLAETMDKAGTQEFILPMSKKDTASYLGTTPETISRKLAELEKQGYIKQKKQKKIEVIDLDGLLLV